MDTTKISAPAGQEFHTNSLTLPIAVSGSNDIVRRFPEINRKVKYVCGIWGTTSSTASSGTASASVSSLSDCCSSVDVDSKAFEAGALSTSWLEAVLLDSGCVGSGG